VLILVRNIAARLVPVALLVTLSVVLTACGGSGDSGGGPTPNVAPSAAFTVTPASGLNPLTVTIDASGSSDPDGSITSYAWNFGDQTASGSGMRVDHVFQAPGSYTITLTVTDNIGATATMTHGVTVTLNAPPVAAFSVSPERGVAPLLVRVDAAASADADGSIARYDWDFADGGVASGVSAEHTFSRLGSFLVRLTVTDNKGKTGITSRELIVMSRVAANHYEMVEIPSLGGWYTEPRAINNHGQVTGLSYFDGNDIEHTFLYSGGMTSDLGTLGGTLGTIAGLRSYGSDINSAGDVVGQSETLDGFIHAFVYRGGSMEDLGTLGGFISEAKGITDSGRIVGTAEDKDGFTRAFTYENGQMTALPIDATYARGEAINSLGVVVAGEFITSTNETHAYVYGDKFVDIGTLGGGQAYAEAINDLGDVIGYSDLPGVGVTGFLYRGGVMRELVPTYNEPNDINNAGVVVGYAHFGNVGHAFVWDADNGIRDLNTLIDPQPGWTIEVATGINDLGQIVARGSRAGGADVAILLTPVF
jgi:probable HAF family extracellular repeat protein